jgi:8-oxo-dGTP diphosphatase
MARWRDGNGKALRDYPQPTVAVDVAVLTVPSPLTEDSRLHLLLHRRADGFAAGNWALPATVVHKRERLAKAAERALKIKAGVSDVMATQLQVFDDPDRDGRGWVMSVAHAALVAYEPLAAAVGQSAEVTLVPVEEGLARLPDRQRRLPFDHERVVELATQWAAQQYAATPRPVRPARRRRSRSPSCASCIRRSRAGPGRRTSSVAALTGRFRTSAPAPW